MLRLPYFWDEAGYYVPAARDLLLTGSLIPHSTRLQCSSAAGDGLSGAVVEAGRLRASGDADCHASGCVIFSARLVPAGGDAWPTGEVAVATTFLTALYPVFFAQSSLVHLDLAAAGLTFWGLRAYVKGRGWETALWFSLACLTKETAILAPLALFAWDLLSPLLAGEQIEVPSTLMRDRHWNPTCSWSRCCR